MSNSSSGGAASGWTEVPRDQRPADLNSCQFAWDIDRPVPKEPEE